MIITLEEAGPITGMIAASEPDGFASERAGGSGSGSSEQNQVLSFVALGSPIAVVQCTRLDEPSFAGPGVLGLQC